jgi:2-polyprenyl-6-methoxyphenol hydroxylase-like FAD-dependent oxidoreductase
MAKPMAGRNSGGEVMAIKSNPSIIVAGGGIGGLSAAMGLARRGARVTVLEQADTFGEIGAGIQIGPNGFHAMDYLGVGKTCRERAVYIDHLIMMDGLTGEEILRAPVDEPFRKFMGNPYAVIHRADLHSAFLDACRASPNVTLVNKERVVSYENTPNGVRVKTAAGAIYEADALIGADGIRSMIREQMTGGDPLRLSGHVAYRAVLPLEQMPEDLRWNAAAIWVGPKTHFVHYPLQAGRPSIWSRPSSPIWRMSAATSRASPRRCWRSLGISCRASGGFWKFRKTGGAGCWAIAIRSRAGSTAMSRCSAMPRIRPTSISRKAPAWRWKIQSACPMRLKRTAAM